MAPRASLTSLRRLLVAFVALVGSAQAIPIDSTRLLGTVNPGSPSSSTDQLNYINTLVGRYNTGAGSGTVSGHTYDLNPGAAVPAPPAPLATAMGAEANANSTSVNLDVTGFTWLLAKVGNTSAVYYIGDLSGQHTLVNDTIFNSNGAPQSFSHYVMAYGGGVSVPDSGTTLLLLGPLLIVLGFLHRRAKSR